MRQRVPIGRPLGLAILLALLIWLLALLRLFVDPTPRLPLLFNWTGSLPYHVAIVVAHARPPQRGDHVVYQFEGGAVASYPGLRNQPFFKQVAGMPGDVVTVSHPFVLVNGEAVGRVRAADHNRRPLRPIAPQVIPPGHYFMRGSSDDSFDSRYAESGLVGEGQILATVQPLL